MSPNPRIFKVATTAIRLRWLGGDITNSQFSKVTHSTSTTEQPEAEGQNEPIEPTTARPTPAKSWSKAHPQLWWGWVLYLATLTILNNFTITANYPLGKFNLWAPEAFPSLFSLFNPLIPGLIFGLFIPSKTASEGNFVHQPLLFYFKKQLAPLIGLVLSFGLFSLIQFGMQRFRAVSVFTISYATFHAATHLGILIVASGLSRVISELVLSRVRAFLLSLGTIWAFLYFWYFLDNILQDKLIYFGPFSQKLGLILYRLTSGGSLVGLILGLIWLGFWAVKRNLRLRRTH